MSGSYQSFEPDYQYKTGEAYDIIEFQLKDFKKDQLKVHHSSKGVLTVSGERPLEGTTWTRFRKEFNPPKDCKSNEIRARFSSGVLYITLPKKVTSAPVIPKRDPSPVQDNGKVKQEMIGRQSSKQSSEAGNGVSSKQSSEAGNGVNLPNEHHDNAADDQRPKSFISRLKMERKTSIKVVAGVTVLALMFTLLFYAYNFYAPMVMPRE